MQNWRHHRRLLASNGRPFKDHLLWWFKMRRSLRCRLLASRRVRRVFFHESIWTMERRNIKKRWHCVFFMDALLLPAKNIFGIMNFLKINMGHQITRRHIVQYLIFFKSVTPFLFAYISAPWYFTRKFLYFRWSYGSNFSTELFSALLACL